MSVDPFPIDAARAGRGVEVAQWQQGGGEVDAPFTFEEWAPLQLLAAEGNKDGVATLLACGASPNGPRGQARGGPGLLAGLPWASPLHVAARFGHAKVVEALGSGGVSVDLRDGHGFTPLHFAAIHGHTGAAEALLALGADPRGRTPAFAGSSGAGGGGAAAAGGAQQQGGYTPSELAAAAGHGDLAELLARKSGGSIGPDREQLKAWLDELDAGQYYSRFVEAGYDFGFIAEHGLGQDDVDAVGVPLTKLGLRKKLMALYKFPKKEDGDEVRSVRGCGAGSWA